MAHNAPASSSDNSEKPLLLSLDNMWEAESIVDERILRNGRGQYLIQWAGFDPSTKERWTPTWESKSGCTADLIETWNAKKKADPSIVGRYSATSRERESETEAERADQDQGLEEADLATRSKRKRVSSTVKDHKKARLQGMSALANDKARLTI